MRHLFDLQLQQLADEIVHMGAMVENAISNASEALLTNNIPLAESTINADALVDQKERDIETACFRLLLTQHPIAKDLRKVSAALKMITDMERIGDQAADICEIVTYLTDTEMPAHSHIKEMARSTVKMVNKAVESYVKSDLDLAYEVMKSDDEVDLQFTLLKKEIITLLQSAQIPEQDALDLLMIGKYFERIGDHAVNISEWVVFSVTGLYKGEVFQ